MRASSYIDDGAVHMRSVKRWTTNLSVKTPPSTQNQGPPATSMKVGQQHLWRMWVACKTRSLYIYTSLRFHSHKLLSNTFETRRMLELRDRNLFHRTRA